MKRYLFKCKTCNTMMYIETELDDRYIHQVPPCPCGKSRMDKLSNDKNA